MSTLIAIRDIVPAVKANVERRMRRNAQAPEDVSILTVDTSMENIWKVLTAAYHEGLVCCPPLAKVRINNQIANR